MPVWLAGLANCLPPPPRPPQQHGLPLWLRPLLAVKAAVNAVSVVRAPRVAKTVAVAMAKTAQSAASATKGAATASAPNALTATKVVSPVNRASHANPVLSAVDVTANAANGLTISRVQSVKPCAKKCVTVKSAKPANKPLRHSGKVVRKKPNVNRVSRVLTIAVAAHQKAPSKPHWLSR